MNDSSPGHPRGLQARFARFSIIVLILAAIAAPLWVYGARMALKSTSNDPRQWLPRDFAETDRYDWFLDRFGTDEITVVSWPGCQLDDPRVQLLSQAFAESAYFSRVRSGPSVIDELMSPPSGFSRAAAIRRLQGLLIGRDGQTTCLVLSTSAEGMSDRSGVVAYVQQQAESVCEIPPEELKLGGPTVDAAMIDRESRRLLFSLAGLSAMVSFAVASIRMRSFRMAVSVLIVAGYCTALALAILYYSGGKMNLLMTMLPPLIYVLTVSSAVHLANYYRDSVNEPDANVPPALLAIGHGWFPCTLAAITTGVGLVSLCLSKIEPIQSFGWFAAVGVVSSVLVLFLLLPAAFHVFPPRFSVQKTDDRDVGRRGADAVESGAVKFVSKHHGAISGVCLVAMLLCASRIPQIESTVKLQDRFLPGSDAIEDYRWLEENIGPMVPLEVVIHIAKGDPRDRIDQIRLVAEVQRKIQSLGQPVAMLSAVNFAPRLPTGHSVRDILQRKVINGHQVEEQLVEARLLSETSDEHLWRISVRAPAIGDLDYGFFAEEIRQAVEPILASQGATGTFTGVIPLIYKAQRQLLLDLFRSFIVAFAVIAGVLVPVLRSVPATLLAMIPNIFPAIIVFGGIQWIGIPVQIGSVMTASAALGIAVDDTVHFLTWFRRGLESGMSRPDAIGNAFARCSGAMLHTTMICAGGLAVFALSSFVPILHFAYLMVFLLFSALVGDLMLLPAILFGPFGRSFERRSSPSSLRQQRSPAEHR